ncbi:MAG: hypothetical protein PUC37_05170 [Spirochaetales bacterium]|nr:hypothetical protein [Spirochaetales bacterium]
MCNFFYDFNLNEVIENNKKYTLVPCHNGTGGTITYLNNKYSGKINILVLRNHISGGKDFLYSIENFETHKKIFIKPENIYKISSYIKDIKIVSLESYMSLKFLFNFFKSLNVQITYDLHDFHCIWIYAHLVQNNIYLDEEHVRKAEFIYGFRKITFEKWHALWSDFLNCVQDIFAFSESSKNIFSTSFPEYKEKVKVTPHSLDYINCGKIKNINKKLTIGIFGLIRASDKGCYVLKDFLNFSKDKDFNIFLFGELAEDCKVYSENIFYKGLYNVSELDKIISGNGISAVLFPSIWPETFSYLVSELIFTGVPVACFNIGAQAEKVSEYKMGEIIKDFSNESIFAALESAHKKGIEYYG